MERFETFFESFGFMRTRFMFHGESERDSLRIRVAANQILCARLAATRGAHPAARQGAAAAPRDGFARKSLSRAKGTSAASILPRRIQQRADRPQQRREEFADKQGDGAGNERDQVSL